MAPGSGLGVGQESGGCSNVRECPAGRLSHSVFLRLVYFILFPFLSFCSRESKYEIKGSKSRSVRERNVSYSSLKDAILNSKSLNGTKKDPKNLTKNARPLRPARKKDKKSMI